jgi:hypothetical protein
MEYGVDGLHPYTLPLNLGGLSYDTPGTTPGIPITFAYFPGNSFPKELPSPHFFKVILPVFSYLQVPFGAGVEIVLRGTYRNSSGNHHEK